MGFWDRLSLRSESLSIRRTNRSHSNTVTFDKNHAVEPQTHLSSLTLRVVKSLEQTLQRILPDKTKGLHASGFVKHSEIEGPEPDEPDEDPEPFDGEGCGEGDEEPEPVAHDS